MICKRDACWLPNLRHSRCHTLAVEIVQHRKDYAALAKRVLTRSDINWKDLLDDPTQSEGITNSAMTSPAQTMALTQQIAPT